METKDKWRLDEMWDRKETLETTAKETREAREDAAGDAKELQENIAQDAKQLHEKDTRNQR